MQHWLLPRWGSSRHHILIIIDLLSLAFYLVEVKINLTYRSVLISQKRCIQTRLQQWNNVFFVSCFFGFHLPYDSEVSPSETQQRETLSSLTPLSSALGLLLLTRLNNSPGVTMHHSAIAGQPEADGCYRPNSIQDSQRQTNGCYRPNSSQDCQGSDDKFLLKVQLSCILYIYHWSTSSGSCYLQ